MPPVTVVYLGGFGRSGSTLVERVLGSIPGWTNLGEVVDLPRSVARNDELCGCGRRFTRCPLWTKVGDLAFDGWTEPVLTRLVSLQRAAARQRHLPGLLSRRRPSQALVQLRSAYSRMYGAAAELTGSRVLVDASKGPALGQALAGSPDIDLRMVNVVRDPRAVAWSWRKTVQRPHASSGADLMWRIPAHRSAVQWSALQLEMAAISAFGGVPCAQVVYEQFVADPVATLVRATAAIGIPVSAHDLLSVSDRQVDLGTSHGLSGNPGRFRSGPIELRRDDSWTVEMPRAERAVVTALTLPLLRRHGYGAALRPRPGPAPRPATRSHP